MTSLKRRGASAHILLVDDDVDTLWLLAHACQLAGYTTTQVSTGRAAIQELEDGSYDVALLDLALPDMSGLEILKAIHDSYPELYAIILTAGASFNSAVTALKLGASDYIEKPVKTRDVLAAISTALTKRANTGQRLVELMGLADQMVGPQASNPLLSAPVDSDRISTAAGPLVFEPERLQVTANGRLVSLTPGEADILEILLENLDKPLSPEEIAVAAWGETLEQVSAESIIRPHIHRLRQKLETKPSAPQIILTVHGKGYVIRSS